MKEGKGNLMKRIKMSNQSIILTITLFITFAAIANLVRFFWDVSICIGSLILPGWTGGFAYLGFGLLSAFSFRALATLSFSPPSNHSNP